MADLDLDLYLALELALEPTRPTPWVESSL